MNIWLINLFDEFPKDREYPGRVVALARALSARGHQVTWWTSDWSHRYKRRRQSPADSDGLRIRALPTLAYWSNSSFRRLWSHERFARTLTAALWTAIDGSERPDALYVNLPVPVVAGSVGRLGKQLGSRVVLDIRDLWPDNFVQVLPAALGMRQWLWPRLLRPFREQARRAIAAADAVCAVSQDYLDAMEPYGLRRGTGHVHYIGASPELLAAQPLPMQQRMDGGASPLRLVYIGGLGASYDLATLGTAMEALTRSCAGTQALPVELHLAGYGDPPPWARWLPQVSFHGMLPPDALRGLLERCHIGLNTVHAGSGIAMPNKIGDYLAAGLPIIHSRTEGELARLIVAHQLGTTYAAGDAETLVKAIQSYSKPCDSFLLIRQSGNARTFAEAHLDRSRIYAALADRVEGQP